MFKNWLDKAIAKMDEISINEESPRKGEKRTFARIDETFFSFKLEGGPKHSELLVATAKIREGSLLFTKFLIFQEKMLETHFLYHVNGFYQMHLMI